ncbi:acyl carrier protein [Lysinimonas soli]|uniref:Acyl carrier protein n=1 Tax=Lysinimonas soli TaxID=1074233 RepID=A0ABW0NMH3_9MICO
MSAITDGIREVLNSNARLAVDSVTLSDDDNLYQQGLTSHAVVNVLMGIEDKFDVEFPDALLRRDTFESVSSLRTALASVGVTDESADAAS